MKKVLFVINTMGRAGAEKSMIELMKVMDKSKYDLHLLVLINRGEMYNELPSYIKVHNKKPDSKPILSVGARLVLVKTVLTTMIKRWSLVYNFIYILKNIVDRLKSNKKVQLDKLFWKIISDGTPVINEEFDTAIAYLEGGAAYYVADHVIANKKAVFIHTDYKKAGFTPMLDNSCYDKMNIIYIVSKIAKESFLNVYPQHRHKVQLFSNIINTKEINYLAKNNIGFQDDFKGIRILTIGRLYYVKGYDIAIPALYKLRNQGYSVRWYVIGEGILRKDLQRMIKEFDLTNDFILMGAVTNPYPYLRECDLYVHATRYEGKSIAIEEAQVLGKAIVASDCTGNREQIVDGENGILVNLQEDEIVREIKNLLENKNLLLKFENNNLKKNFDYRKNLDALYQFMEEKNERYVNSNSSVQ